MMVVVESLYQGEFLQVASKQIIAALHVEAASSKSLFLKKEKSSLTASRQQHYLPHVADWRGIN